MRDRVGLWSALLVRSCLRAERLRVLIVDRGARHMHRRDLRVDFHHCRMAIRHKDGLLLRRLVAEPTILLLGDRIRQ